MKIMRLTGTLLCSAVLLAAAACSGPKIDTQPEDFKISDQTVSFAPPPSETWKKQDTSSEKLDLNDKKTAAPIVVRYISTKDPNQFVSASAVDFGIKSWTEDPKKTAEVVRGLQDQILKRKDSQILEQKQIKLNGEDALLLSYTYLEGTVKTWGSQILAFHNQKLWTISCSSSEKDKAETKAVINHIADTLQFK